MEQKIKDTLDSSDAFEKYEKLQELYVILIDGKRVKMQSGKSFWSGTGPAKNALNLHISNLLQSKSFKISDYVSVSGRKNWDEMRQKQKEIIRNWIEEHIMFVPFDTYMSALRKRTK